MKEKKVASLKIVFEDGSDYSVACEKGLDKDELAEYIERAFKPEPAEPLIKDENIRKAVRAWAEANKVFGASTYKSCSDGHYWYIRAFNDTERGIDIDLWGDLPKELIDCKYYTIAELCGEEEE